MSTVADVVTDVVRYGDRGVLITVREPGNVPGVLAALGPQARPGWRSVLLPGDTDARRVRARLGQVGLGQVGLGEAAAHPGGAELTIPMHYDGEDLEEIAQHAGCGVEEVVRLHSEATYTVVLLGFGRAFPYLAGLPPALCGVPRRATPRVRVPAGSVALVADMAGIYPAASPGGWALLGRAAPSAPSLFDADATPPTPLRVGMSIRFVVA